MRGSFFLGRQPLSLEFHRLLGIDLCHSVKPLARASTPWLAQNLTRMFFCHCI
jgi:hypothetical protein